MNETINYITSDLYLTAFLKVKGYKFKVEKNKLKYKFIFEESAEILSDVNDYLTESRKIVFGIFLSLNLFAY
jgi:CYTH domain-containing protein